MPLTHQKHYTVGYFDNQHIHHEICEYADNAYDAIQQLKEDVSLLREHPHFIDYCKPDRKTEVENIYDFLAAGIPMGH